MALTPTQDAVLSLLNLSILAYDGRGAAVRYDRWNVREHGRDLILWTRVAGTERVISIGARGKVIQLNSDGQEEVADLLLAERLIASLPGLQAARRNKLEAPTSGIKHVSRAG
jgi:hypothetical protein